MAAFFHPQFRFHGPGGAELNREQLWDYFASCRAAFDDFSVTRQALVSDGGDYIASRTRFAGVFARTFTGVPEGPIEPNGKRFEYRPMNIFRYAPNGQLVEEWCSMTGATSSPSSRTEASGKNYSQWRPPLRELLDGLATAVVGLLAGTAVALLVTTVQNAFAIAVFVVSLALLFDSEPKLIVPLVVAGAATVEAIAMAIV